MYHLRSSFLLPTFLCCNEEGLFICNSLSFARISKGGNQSNTIFLYFIRQNGQIKQRKNQFPEIWWKGLIFRHKFLVFENYAEKSNKGKRNFRKRFFLFRFLKLIREMKA